MGRGAVVLLGGSDHTTDIVAHYLAGHVQAPTVIIEQPPSRVHMAVRRAHSVVGNPASTIRRAIGAPWLPSPMNPTRVREPVLT